MMTGGVCSICVKYREEYAIGLPILTRNVVYGKTKMVPMRHIGKQGCLHGYVIFVIAHLQHLSTLKITNQKFTHTD